MADLSHAGLCSVAVRWLKRPWSAGGHGCSVAVSECRSGFVGEIPDAIGFRANWNNGSVLVECKASRADFLADRAKPHRQPGAGMGTWRYYMAPEGLIRPEELPEKWGLLEVNSRGHVKARAGVVAAKPRTEAVLEAFRHAPDHDAERNLLVLLLARVGDPNKVTLMVREANNRVQHLAKKLERERQRHQETLSRLWKRNAEEALNAPCTLRFHCDCLGSCKLGRGGNGAEEAPAALPRIVTGEG